MLSGAYGDVNGIIANDWYDRERHDWIYCAKDTSVAIIGAPYHTPDGPDAEAAGSA